jgi:hypothetical protein
VNRELFEAYWYLSHERLMVYYRRLQGSDSPWTDDAILREYKFTNTFRAADRVSQYLIRNVVYKGEQDPREVVFRIFLFKLFNRIETWKQIVAEMGIPVFSEFSVEHYGKLLDSFERLFNNAYMITGHKIYGYDRKHWNYLMVLHSILVDSKCADVVTSLGSMREVYEFILSHKGIKEFLAYQYTTDINYSTLTDFSENEFTVPGVGARRGIKRCFNLTDKQVTEQGEAIIMWMVENQQVMFDRMGLDFTGLFGRPLHAIDCQNIFCELDKYARVAFPDSDSYGKKRIKQKYTASTLGEWQPWFPPKWGINFQVKEYLNGAL